MFRSILLSLTGAVIVIIAFTNVWAFIDHFTSIPARRLDSVSIQENRFRGVREALLAAHYTSGNVGYMPVGVLKGRARTTEEDVSWVEARYVMIPINVRQETLDAPYVILDMAGWEGPAEIPDGFSAVYSSNEGLILLRKMVRP